MCDEKTVQRFIELRASGWTCARRMSERNTSKPTLIAWRPKYPALIQDRSGWKPVDFTVPKKDFW